MPTYVLTLGREKSLLHRHPWVFSGAIANIKGDVAPGATVEVMAEDGRFLARAAASPASQIRARVWSFDPDEKIDAAFFQRRLAAAVAWRRDQEEGRMLTSTVIKDRARALGFDLCGIAPATSASAGWSATCAACATRSC